MAEVMVIAVVALIFLGPDKLPSVIRSIAKAYGFLIRLKTDISKAVEENLAPLEKDKLTQEFVALKKAPAAIKNEVNQSLKGLGLLTPSGSSQKQTDVRRDIETDQGVEISKESKITDEINVIKESNVTRQSNISHQENVTRQSNVNSEPTIADESNIINEPIIANDLTAAEPVNLSK
jgi:sec-independent protein translocase protein TatB